MADVLFGKNEFNAALAMLSHEGANGIVKLLNQGKQEEAFKYTAGLIDTWTNRASGTNGNVIDQMSKPYQITDWDRNQSVIDKKALGLDTRIRDMAAAYVQGRLGGNDAIHPKANFYLNKDLVDAFHLENPQKYTQSYRNWYDGANDVVSYGDKGRGGKNSTETQFVSTTKDRKVADSYKLVSRGDLNLKPTDSAQNLYFLSSGDPKFSVDPGARINAPLGHIDVSQGLGDDGSPELANYTFGLDGPQQTARYFAPDSDAAPTRPTGTGIVGALNDFSDGITEGLEGAGRAAADVAGQIGGAISGLFPGTPQPAPGPYDFANGSTAGGDTPNGDFGAGITPQPPAPAPGPYDFAGGFNPSGGTPNGSFGDGITQPGSQTAPTLPPTQSPTIGTGPQAAAVPFDGFDARAYLAANPDVASSATYASNPLQHYLDYGFKEGRTLDPEGHQIAQGIDLSRYLQSNPDVAAARIDPLTHFLVNGAAEGRTLGPGSTGLTIGAPAATNGVAAPGLSPLVGPTAGESVTASPGIGPYDFSSTYLQANPDVAKAGMNAFEHYARFGAREGRAIDAAGDRFDPNAYLAQNVDVREAGQDALTHYLTYGASEGRGATLIGPDGTARTVSSLGVTPTISAMLTPFLQPQWTAAGVTAPQGQTIGAPGLSPTLGAQTAPTIGPSPSETVRGFDAAAYLQANPDVAASSIYAGNPLEHYETYGFNEGRALDASGLRLNQVFDGNSYLGANPDVARAGMNPLDHYLRFGIQEGRQIGAPSATPWVMPSTAQTVGAQAGATIGPQTAPTLGPSFAPTIEAPPAIQATSPGYSPPLSGYDFGSNVSKGVPNGSFGAGLSLTPSIPSYGFSGLNPSGFLGATPQGLGGSYAVGSAVSNLGLDLPGGGESVDPYSFSGSNVSGYDVNQGGGSAPAAPAPEASIPSGFGDGGAVAARGSQLAQEAFFKSEREKQALMTANTNLFGQQITNIAPGNQTVYDYATGKATGGQAPQIQPFSQAPVNMSGVFAPLPTAVFMPRFMG